jgi:hypothetical protein
MMVLAPAIAFVAVDGFARNFGPWEKTVLAALWLVPVLARSVAQISLIPLGVRRCSRSLFSYCGAADFTENLAGKPVHRWHSPTRGLH